MGSGGLKAHKYSSKDYQILEYISEGAWGKVYAANQKSTNQKVALKFFGYTQNQPNSKDIQRELQLMLNVNGIVGVVQTFGYFLDTTEGIIPDKIYKDKYSVIIMELLEGGHMLSRVNSQKYVSEHYLALTFKRLILAIDSLHRKQFIHRDIKLENIMFLDSTDYSPVKIIDLGMMVHCPFQPSSTSAKSRSQDDRDGDDEKIYNFVYQDTTCRGTPGYVAPESITLYQYSPKSDIWQAGCVLYSLLSGMPAFNPNIPEQATDMTYFPMRGQAWDCVSDMGKDLVCKILKKDPKRRLSSAEILDHPWLQKAPCTSLGEDYLSRMKQLLLRQRLKAFFVDNNIEKHSKERRQHLEAVLPFLSHYSGMKSASTSARGSPITAGDNKLCVSTEHIDPGHQQLQMDSPDKRPNSSTIHAVGDGSPGLAVTPEKEFRDKLRTLKIEVIRSVSLVDRGVMLDGEDEEIAEALKKTTGDYSRVNERTSTSTPMRSSGLRVRHINYDTFVSILGRCELPELANRQVFNIFDWKNCGTIDMKEFLMTMLAFQPISGFNHSIKEGSHSDGRENDCSYDSKEEDRGSGDGHRGLNLSDRLPQYSPSASEKQIDDDALLYFRMFDVYERGYLTLEDLKIGIECILFDPADEYNSDRGQASLEEEADDIGINIETLFNAIDVSHTGKVNYQEFVIFYRSLLTQTMASTNKTSRRLRSHSRSMDP